MVDQAELISAAQAGDRSPSTAGAPDHVDTTPWRSGDVRRGGRARRGAGGYLRAWKGIDRSGVRQFSALAVPDHANCAVDVRGQSAAACGPTRLLPGQEPADLHAESQPSGMAESGASRLLARAVAELPPKLRAVVVLRRYGVARTDRGRARSSVSAPRCGCTAAGAVCATPSTRTRGRPCGLRTSRLLPACRTDRAGRTRRLPSSMSISVPASCAVRKLLRALEQLRTPVPQPSPGPRGHPDRAGRGGGAPGGPFDDHGQAPRLTPARRSEGGPPRARPPCGGWPGPAPDAAR